MKILTNHDYNGNQIMNVAIQNLATAPANPVLGQVYFNTANKRLFTWNGTAWVGADANDAVMTGASIVSAINGSTSKIDDDNLSASVNTAIADAHSTHAISDVTGLQTALDGKVDDSQVLTNVPTGAVFTDTVTSINGKTGVIAKADITALGIPAQDTVYTHPTGDGNQHIPVTGTSNSGKVLTAGSTAGSGAWTTPAVAWANITSKPSSTVANLDAAVTAMHSHSNKALLDTYTQTEANLASAVAIKHTQNTDTGTSNATFTVGSSGVKIKNSSGTELQVRNNADTAYADIRVKNLYVEGDTTTINSQTVAIGDSDIELNTDITTNAQNSDGGITVKRLKADNTTRADAKMMFNSSTCRWQAVMGAVANSLVVAPVAVKIVATIGDGTSTSFQIPHNLGTNDLSVTIRQIGPPFEQVFADVAFPDDDYITVSFASPPSSSTYSVIIIG